MLSCGQAVSVRLRREHFSFFFSTLLCGEWRRVEISTLKKNRILLL